MGFPLADPQEIRAIIGELVSESSLCWMGP